MAGCTPRLAWKLHSTAMPILALAHRLCDDIPADFHEEWGDGRRYGERAAASKFLEFLRLGYESGVYAGASPDSVPRSASRAGARA
jgi:hypothetical protein